LLHHYNIRYLTNLTSQQLSVVTKTTREKQKA